MPDSPAFLPLTDVPAFRDLLDAAHTCDRAQTQFPGDHSGHRRARQILTALTRHCHTAAGVFDADPTLADEPDRTGRFQALHLLAETARQACGLLPTACRDTDPDRRSGRGRWHDVETLYDRAAHYAKAIPRAISRPDHATEAGSQAISRDRLAAYADHLDYAVDVIDAAIAPALRLPHRDPTALAVAELGEQLTQHATALAAHHTQQIKALGAACKLPGHQRNREPINHSN